MRTDNDITNIIYVLYSDGKAVIKSRQLFDLFDSLNLDITFHELQKTLFASIEENREVSFVHNRKKFKIVELKRQPIQLDLPL